MAKVKFITGNFEVVVEGTFNPDQQAAADAAALRWILQRDGATKAYIELAGVKNSKGNLALPEGFERDSLEYGEDAAALFKDAFQHAMSGYGNFTISSVTEHVKSEGAAADGGQSAINLWERIKAEPEMFNLEKLGITDIADEEAGLAAARAFLTSIRPPRKAKA